MTGQLARLSPFSASASSSGAASSCAASARDSSPA